MKLTVGREDPAVYWKRRAIVLGALLGLVLLMAVSCNLMTGSAADGGGPRSEPAASDSAEGGDEPATFGAPADDELPPGIKRPYIGDPPSTAADSPSASAGDAACRADDLTIVAVPARRDVATGAPIPISVVVTNAGEEACTQDLALLEVLLYAGEQRVFSTWDCDRPDTADERRLETRKSVTVSMSLDGKASSEGCAGERRQLPGGDYELAARLGDIEADPAPVTLA